MRLKKSLLSACLLLAIALIAFTLSTSDHSTPAIDNSSDFIPESLPLLQRKSYLLSYDSKTRNASWVYEKITADSLNGATDRNHFDFAEDKAIPSSLRATKNDYKATGFDRGHLCPAADAKSSEEAMKETFYLSNIAPQNPQLNRKYWLKLEKHARELTKAYDVVEIVSGPLYLPQEEKDGKRYVKYQVIGKNDVAVPTHFFKVMRCKSPEAMKIEAYIVPNEPIVEQPIENFIVPQEKVEKAAGVIFRSK